MPKYSPTDDSAEAPPRATGPRSKGPRPTAEQREAEQQLRRVQKDILRLTQDIRTAEDKDQPRLMRELQRNRVALLSLQEIATGVADPTTYREMALLNKLSTGLDPEEDAAERAAQEAEAATVERLSSVGLTPERATQMVRVFQALSSLKPLPPADDDDAPAPRPQLPA